MKRLLVLALLPALPALGEVRYFSGPGAEVPEGEVKAVEVRAYAGKHSGSWSVSWPGAELFLTVGSESFMDGVDHRGGILRVNGIDYELGDFVEPGGANSLAVEWGADSIARLLVGARELHPVGSTPLGRPQGEVTVKSISGHFDLIDLIIETDPNAFSRLESGLADEDISKGKLWNYLDREGDKHLAVAGGQYQLRLVGNDLIYVGGARTNPMCWKPGMVKGRLLPTGFDGYYKLQWFDASGRELSGENYAEIDSDLGTLKLTFPQLKTSLRFHD